MSGFFIVLIGLVVVAAVVKSSINTQQARARAWGQFAASRGLTFHEAPLGGTPRISGTWGGVPVTLALEYQGSGKNRTAYTRATARIQAALPRGLTVSAEGFADRFIKLLGGQDIQVGLPELDQKLRIKADDEGGARRVFQNWRFRQAVLSFVLCGRGATLSQHQATVAQQGFLSLPNELAGLLDLAARCAREVDASFGGEPATGASGGSAQPAAGVQVGLSDPVRAPRLGSGAAPTEAPLSAPDRPSPSPARPAPVHPAA
ncbi:MAG: hypothetical protein ABIO70_15280, partial [Pseudomonadota bacterium]